MNNEKLTIEHLAPYLPYGLRFTDGILIAELVELSSTEAICHDNSIGISRIPLTSVRCKPILRPLSDLTKEEYKIQLKTMRYKTDKDSICNIISDIECKVSEYGLILWLLENHFDINNLIKKGLAIDINTIG